MRKGFTLIEVLVAVVIIGTLAGISLARFSTTKKKVSQRQAESYLRAVRISQKMYNARNGAYYSTSCANAAAIKAALGTEISDPSGYTISMAGTATTFTVTATRSSDGLTTTLDQAGTWGGTYAPLPPA